jgi:hypothetical protein
LGVREGVLTILLGRLFPSYIASAAAVLCRIVFTLAEITTFLIAVGIDRFCKNGKSTRSVK